MAGRAPDPEPRDTGADAVERLFEQGDRSARALRTVLARIAPAPLASGWTAVGRWLNRRLPKGLLARAVLILVVPIVLLQTVLAFVFLDRHWQLVTSRLSSAVSRDIGAVVDLVEAAPDTEAIDTVLEVALRRLRLRATLGLPEDLPPQEPPGFGAPLMERTLVRNLESRLRDRFQIDVLQDEVVVRAETSRGLLTFRLDRNLAYAANWHIFLVWMVSTSLVLTLFAVLFLRNQIKPILRLAAAAEAFGRGRPVPNFVPQGAREVRRASQAFIAMRRRIERQIEQRTTMLAGVSHDLRTMLTRLRLELAMMPPGNGTEAMARDIEEMGAMLEAYMAFAKGDPDEEPEEVDVAAVVEDVAGRHAAGRVEVTTRVAGEPVLRLKPAAFRRLLENLVGNAVKYGRSRVEVSADHSDGWLTLIVDDDGPGIPEAEREAVFRPFVRLDEARNQDAGGTGLGLSIARDVARSQGGDVRIETSPLGGARAVVRLPG